VREESHQLLLHFHAFFCFDPTTGIPTHPHDPYQKNPSQTYHMDHKNAALQYIKIVTGSKQSFKQLTIFHSALWAYGYPKAMLSSDYFTLHTLFGSHLDNNNSNR